MSFPDIYILSGPVHGGKTTRLLEWASSRKDVYGILTPVIDGKRYFADARTLEQWPMEALPDEADTLLVGRFSFSRPAFDRAIMLLRECIQCDGWLVIDEIGPLELRGEGFGFVLQDILKERKGKLLLVARDKVVENLKKTFRLPDLREVKDMLMLVD